MKCSRQFQYMIPILRVNIMSSFGFPTICDIHSIYFSVTPTYAVCPLSLSLSLSLTLSRSLSPLIKSSLYHSLYYTDQLVCLSDPCVKCLPPTVDLHEERTAHTRARARLLFKSLPLMFCARVSRETCTCVVSVFVLPRPSPRRAHFCR